MSKTRKLEWAYALFGTSIVVFIVLALIGGFIYYSVTDFRKVMFVWMIGSLFGMAFFLIFLVSCVTKLRDLITEKRSSMPRLTTEE